MTLPQYLQALWNESWGTLICLAAVAWLALWKQFGKQSNNSTNL